MPTDSSSQGGRRHFHRGRRGHERRGGERRQPQHQQGEQPSRGDHVEVEQIMRDIRAKIAQRHGVELTDQQVQELAARRLESILDPRTVKPALLDQLRRAAGTTPATVTADRAEAPYTFEATTLYDSTSGLVRFLRKLLNPILKLFFNPNPIIRALNVQSRLNAEALKREAERDRRQAEWNALHFEILQRLVGEIAKVSLEIQSFGLRVESLSTKIDFNERRVRGIEGALHHSRPSGQRERERDRDREIAAQPFLPPAPISAPTPEAPEASTAPATQEAAQGEAPRRRRRRRRGRRGGAGELVAPGAAAGTAVTQDALEGEEGDEGEAELPETVTTEGEAVESTAPISDVKVDSFMAPSPREMQPEPERPAESEVKAAPKEPTPERGPTEQ